MIEVWSVALITRRDELKFLGVFKTEDEAYTVLLDYYRNNDLSYFFEGEISDEVFPDDIHKKSRESQREAMKIIQSLIKENKSSKEILDNAWDYEDFCYNITKSIIYV